jgi:tetratricopeptide (TPR) repeat protein
MSLVKMMMNNVRFLIAFAVIGVSSAVASATELQDVKTLLKDGNLTEALNKANRALAANGTDASMQFVKGLILSEQKRTAEAIEVFSKLTVDHPDYPEPYNNLAVLFATVGQYTKARISLETALKLNPKYTTAQENLGDVYLQSALQSYSDATKNDSASPGLKTKLKNLKTSMGVTLFDPSSTAAKTGSSDSPTIVSDSTAANAKGAGTPKDAQSDRDAVLKAVDQWSRAWAAKDTKTYFSLYADNFKTSNGQSHEAWQKSRRSKIEGKSEIEVQVLSPSVTIENRTATVKFQQIYVSGKISSNSRKSLILVNQDGVWRITQEKSDS